MDENLLKVLSENKFDTNHLEIGRDVSFINDNEELIVEFIAKDNRRFSYKLNLINNLYSGDKAFEYENENWDDKYMPILICVETAITEYYIQNPDLKDKTIIFLLERIISNPDIRMTNELCIRLQNNLKLCLSLNRFSKNELKGSLKRILKSVKRHHKIDGKTGYLDFITNFLKRAII